ncbi:MAG: glycosyltransferase family A protein [Acidobacteriota bacterium]
MSNLPQLSVIIPTYNRAALLRKTLESVFEQTFSDYEIIVVDDGSTDRTEESIAQLLKERPTQDKRIHYFYQRNQGKSVALNRGLSEARGEWIAFLDSDDLWLPGKIEQQFKVLQQYAPQSEACFTNARYINNPAFQGTVFESAAKRYPGKTGVLDDLTRFVANPFGIFMQTLLMHSRLLSKVGEFDPTLWVIQDIDFIFRVAKNTRLCFVNEPLVLIDRTPQRSEGLIEILVRNDQRSLDEQQRMYEQWLSLSKELGTEVQKAIRGRLRGIHSQRANWHLMNKRYKEARHALSSAARAGLTPGTAAKWCLAAAVPSLARSVVLQRSRFGNGQNAFLAMGCVDVKDRSASGKVR